MSDLRTLLDDLVSRSALPASSVSTAALTGYFPGLTISDRTRLRDVIEEVQGLLQFDAITSGNALRFSHRGRASMLAIPEADLMPLKPGSGDTLLLTRLAADALPEQLDVVYADAARDYQPVTQRAQRQITEGQKTDTVRFGGVLNASQARRAAQILLDTALQERTRYQFTLPAKYLALEPGDVVTLTVKNQAHVVRLTRCVAERGTLQVEGVSTDAATYQQSQLTTSAGNIAALVIAGGSTLYALDIPLVDESDDTLCWYAAASKKRGDTRWQYAALYESFDDVAYEPRTLLNAEAIAGKASTALAAALYPATWDTKNTVEVTLDDGALQSFSDDLVLNGANTAVLGSEILQFANATLVGTNRYRLSRLLRGRRGTEWAMGSHAVNERFVLLGGEVVRQPLAFSNLGVLRYEKAVSNGALLDDAAAVSLTPSGASLKPFAPVHLRAARNGSGDITLSWIRRARLAAGWQDNSDTALDESLEQYEVEILNGASVVRTLGVMTPTAIYTAAQQIADFSAAQSSLSVRVYQLSSRVGRGTAAAAVV